MILGKASHFGVGLCLPNPIFDRKLAREAGTMENAAAPDVSAGAAPDHEAWVVRTQEWKRRYPLGYESPPSGALAPQYVRIQGRWQDQVLLDLARLPHPLDELLGEH